MEHGVSDTTLVRVDGQPSSHPRGTIVRVRGSVIDARFNHGMPDLHNELRAGDDAEIVIEVVNHLDAQTVRGIALTPTEGLARGPEFGQHRATKSMLKKKRKNSEFAWLRNCNL